MSDGAHLGYKPQDVLKVVLGGEDEDTSKRQSDADFAAWIRSAPTTLTSGGYDYDSACRIMARCMLAVLEDDATTDLDATYDAAKARFPDSADAFDGCTGFMAGWAYNAARHVLALPPTPNPAIITVEIPT